MFNLPEYLKKGLEDRDYKCTCALSVYSLMFLVFPSPVEFKKRFGEQRLLVHMSVLALFLFIHLCFRCLIYQSISKKVWRTETTSVLALFLFIH